jgi:hypothetical protein
MSESEFTKEIRFTPAFDRRHPDPEHDYGIHGVDLWFFLKGPKGAVHFRVMTNWQLPHVQQETDARMLANPDRIGLGCLYHPMPADVSYHSPVPMYEGQRPHGSMRTEWRDPTEEEKKAGWKSKMPVTVERDTYSECDLVEGGMCFSDGSTLSAVPVFEILLSEGSDGVWKRLEEKYRSTFE